MDKLASKSGEVTFNRKGDPGAQGNAGPLVFPVGEFSSTVTYTRTELSAPMVLCNEQYYVLNKLGAYKGINPKTDYAANGSKATWILMDKFQYAFAEVLMANFAKLASAVFHGNYMFSQQGVNASGVSTNDYRKFGTSDFTPNLLLNFLDGSGHLAKKNIFWDESGHMYRKARDIIVWRRLSDEIGSATSYQLDLTRGTYLDTRASDATVLLPPAEECKDFILEVYDCARTRTLMPFCKIKCPSNPILQYDPGSQSYKDVIVHDPGLRTFGNAFIRSVITGAGYRWVADQSFLT